MSIASFNNNILSVDRMYPSHVSLSSPLGYGPPMPPNLSWMFAIQETRLFLSANSQEFLEMSLYEGDKNAAHKTAIK